MLANFKAALAAREIKQADLAFDLRIPASVISEIVNERRRADAYLRGRIARALGADESWLFSSLAKIPEPVNSGESED